ncbi:MAG: DUF1800 family protein, partial [Bacteroidota bacterium]
LFRNYATGNFRDLVKEVTIHPSMLKFLNGDQNDKFSPNENYARELLELFTIGKGAQVGPGDYTNYTEQDVMEMARVLTGWRTSGYWSTNPNDLPNSWFEPGVHDTGNKTLSHRFDNSVITNGGQNEYAQLIDLIFTKDEVARFICRKLYRYFVYYQIDEEIESLIIEPLANQLIANDYSLAPILETLLKSQHFYDIGMAGDVIKNPMEFLLSITRPLQWGNDFDTQLKYDAGEAMYWWSGQIDMDFLYPPSVSGWKAWHLAPSYNRLWLNGTTLQLRTQVSNAAAHNGIWVSGGPRSFNWLAFIENFDNPFDPNDLVWEFAEIFLPQQLRQAQLDGLKAILIPGLPDFEWTDEYGLHIINPEDSMLRTSVENKLKSLARALFQMAEFHLN